MPACPSATDACCQVREPRGLRLPVQRAGASVCGTMENSRRNSISSAKRRLSSLSYSHQRGTTGLCAMPWRGAGGLWREVMVRRLTRARWPVRVSQIETRRSRAASHCCARCSSAFDATAPRVAAVLRVPSATLGSSDLRRCKVASVGSGADGRDGRSRRDQRHRTGACRRVAREALQLRLTVAVDGRDVAADDAAFRHE